MKIGIVGLPLAGKSTLFNALTGSNVDTGAFITGKTDAHQSIVQVPDERLEKLNKIFVPKKKTPAIIDYIDLAGLNSAEQKKGGFSDSFLGQVRTVDALLTVVRAFKDENVPHPQTSVNPKRDLDMIEADFILSDLSIVENRMQRLQKQMKSKKLDQDVREYALLEKCKASLEDEQPLRLLHIAPEEEFMVRGYQFLTLKPLIIVLNISESDIANDTDLLEPFLERKKQPLTTALAISAQIEMEIQQLADEEAATFRQELGIKQSAMDVLIRTSYDLLGLVSFFTVGSDEVRAWTIKKNTAAPQAAGAIHTDFERGFIRAEIVHYDDFMKYENMVKCKADGLVRLEGKEYIVKDGDIINFRFAI